MWIKRIFERKIRELSAQRPALVLTGARQTGKTTLLKHLFPAHRFVSLDLPEDAARAEVESAEFFAHHPPPVVVDEVQYAPGLFRYVKAAVDRHRERQGSFILTGSQKFLLMKGISDSLAGRVAILELEPLSYGEIHSALPEIGVPHLGVESAMIRGGYPELYANPALDANEYYRSYLATYLERDVRSLLNIGSLRDFERFIRACALRSGQILNKSELARDVGVSPSTSNQWLSVLAASNQIFLLEPWFTSGSKSLVKSPKLYLADTGMLLFLLNIRSTAELAASPYVGAAWETFVFSELRKRQSARQGGWSLFFWRDRSREVDFLIHRGGRFEISDAKWSTAPTNRDAEGLLHLRKALGADRILSSQLICRTPEAFPVGPGVRAVGVLDPLFEGDSIR